MNRVKAGIIVTIFGLLAACGGGGGGGGDGNKSASSNVGGGFTLLASGGTINDGSGNNGLALLATLRDGNGAGPGLSGGWQVAITGPGIARPLTVSYDDGSPSSYQLWRWEGLNPATGTYTATATNGAVTLSRSFTINSANSIQRVALTKNGSTLSWNPVSGAGSYYYQVSDGSGSTAASGYLTGDPALAAYSFQLPTLADGSYLVEVFAHTQTIPRLMSDSSSAPSLSPQENISVAQMGLVIAGGTAGSYDLAAKGGILYLGKDSVNVDRYGLTVWSSILTSTATPPAGDWTVAVTGPGITDPLTFTYPKTDTHYLYWDFATPPASGSYTLTATSPGYSLTAGFTIPNQTAQLPAATNVTVTPTATSYSINWNTVTGAASYYVNLWATVGGVYTEIAGEWVNGSAVSVPKVSLTKGILYDVYVTAATLDMTTTKSLPPPKPAQVDMSDNTYGAVSFTAQ
jgi:hypothetical protein